MIEQNNSQTFVPDRLRVSILERLVPMLSFALAAIGGGVGAFLVWKMFDDLRMAEAAGIAAVAGGTAEANIGVLAGLYLALVVGFLGIVVAVIRMFTAKSKSSPPGLLYVIPGLIALIPAGLVWYVESLIMGVILQTAPIKGGGIAEVANIISILLIAAIVAAPVIVLIHLAAVFIPFSARSGRKFGPLIILLIIGLIFVVAAGAFQYRTMILFRTVGERGAVHFQQTHAHDQKC